MLLAGRAAIRDVRFTTGLYCSLSSRNEGKQSTIMTLGMVVVFKLEKPGDLRVVTGLHCVVLAKKIPGDENWRGVQGLISGTDKFAYKWKMMGFPFS